MNGVNIGSITFYDYHPKPADFKLDVLGGLQQEQKKIPPKYFYDQRGSELFDAICDLEEYYPTRTELSILQENSAAISECVGTECMLIEPGSGSSYKVRTLLDNMKPQAYIPMDISKTFLIEAANKISDDYPWLDVHASCIDFTDKLHLPATIQEAERKVAFFPGSSIGNFEPDDAVGFLTDVAEMVGKEGGLLIGVDLKKEKDMLDAAYNDAKNITADFNLNLLNRINSELNAEFSLENFEHRAFYNEQKGRIEMHLVSKIDQQIKIEDSLVDFERDETIHTENSYKYSVEEFQRLASNAGFSAARVWTDENEMFSLHYYTTT